jgi:hypothetical protein
MGGGSKEWPLKYWLSGEDALVDQKWVDRINPNIQWSVGVLVTHDTENNRYLFMGRTAGKWVQDYRATLPANLINLYNFGYHWKMIVRGEFLYAPATMTSMSFFIDFASVRYADFNIGWGTGNKGFVQNFKTFGNSEIYSCVDENLLADATSNPYPFEVEFGCEAVSETTSRLYTLYDGTYFYGHTFNNMLFTNWQSADFYIGMGNVGKSYGCDFYLNDWKIYVEPYSE